LSDEEISDWERWKSLILFADYLDENAERGSVDLDEVIWHFEGIEEIFPKTLDPVDAFEEYAVRRLCKSLKSALIQIQKKRDAQSLSSDAD
jgi:hypothetical protein